MVTRALSINLVLPAKAATNIATSSPLLNECGV
jgi:hypothetical protein